MKLSRLIVAALILGALLGDCRGKGKTDDPGAVRSLAPDFTLVDLSGASHTLSAYKGKVVLLDFWATWCPPCRAQIPHLARIYDTYKSSGLVVIGVSLDRKRQDVAEFINDSYVPYLVLHDEGNVAGRLYNIEGIPRTIILDKRGRIAQDHAGFASGMEAELEAQVKSLLAEEY